MILEHTYIIYQNGKLSLDTHIPKKHLLTRNQNSLGVFAGRHMKTRDFLPHRVLGGANTANRVLGE